MFKQMHELIEEDSNMPTFLFSPRLGVHLLSHFGAFSYLTMFIMLSHPKHFKEGQNPYTAMAEALQPLEDRQQAPLDKFTTMDDQAEEAVLIKGPRTAGGWLSI